MSDPVQAHFVAALERRMQRAPEAVQRVLRARLQQAWTGQASTGSPTPAAHTRAPSPLAQLNRDIAATAPPGRELRSAQSFRDTWSRICADDEVTQAVAQGPENAGPLNSHRLVLRTLALMRDLSPDYLRRFLSHADTLLWLEQAQSPGRPKPPAAKPRPARTRK